MKKVKPFLSEEFMATQELSKQKQVEKSARQFISKVYAWMTVALVVSGFAAWYTANSQLLINLIWGTRFGFLVLIIAEIALVWWLSASIGKISASGAIVAFVVYSLLNGMMLSSIFVVYTSAAIGRVFLITAGMFGAMTLYGMFTKQKLNSFGRYFMMALFGVIIASLLNFLFRSSVLDIIISIVTLVIFIGLTAYDTQKIMKAAAHYDGSEMFQKAAVISALELYLDFINIFLVLLRLFGRSQD